MINDSLVNSEGTVRIDGRVITISDDNDGLESTES